MKYLLIFCLLLISGCSLLVDTNGTTRVEPEVQVVLFQDLLREGWQIQLHENKEVILVKPFGNHILIYDVFEFLE